MVGDLYSPPAPRRRVDRATWDREIKPVVARLAAADEQVATTALGALRKVLPSYRDVSDDALRASALRNPAYHLTPDLRYVALRGRPAPGTSAAQLVRAITAAVRAGGQHGFVDILEGDVVGVAPRAPELDGFPGIVGVGPPADLSGIEPSF